MNESQSFLPDQRNFSRCPCRLEGRRRKEEKGFKEGCMGPTEETGPERPRPEPESDDHEDSCQMG